jgi:hypothetical protein
LESAIRCYLHQLELSNEFFVLFLIISGLA